MGEWDWKNMKIRRYLFSVHHPRESFFMKLEGMLARVEFDVLPFVFWITICGFFLLWMLFVFVFVYN